MTRFEKKKGKKGFENFNFKILKKKRMDKIAGEGKTGDHFY